MTYIPQGPTFIDLPIISSRTSDLLSVSQYSNVPTPTLPISPQYLFPHDARLIHNTK